MAFGSGVALNSRLLASANSPLNAHSTEPAKGIVAEIENLQFPDGTPDWAKIRAQFPVTAHKAYFNTASFGPSPEPVISAVLESIQQTEHSGEKGSIKSLPAQLGKFIGCDETEISLTNNTTMGINLVAWGLQLKKGDEVILTSHEHVGGALPWIRLSQVSGIKLRVFEPGNSVGENISKIKSQLTTKTRVIAIPHISCTTGCRFPLEEIATLAKESGIFCFVDGAHGLGSTTLKLHEWGVDAYAGSGHKWLCGPAGTGFLYIRKDKLSAVNTTQVGAYSDATWRLDPQGYELTLKEDASRYFYGTQNNSLFKGMAAAIGFLEKIEMIKVENRIAELNNYLFDSLSALKNIEIISPQERQSRGPMLSFRHREISTPQLRKALSAGGFRVRQIYEAELDAIRVSTHFFNDFSEINSLVNDISALK